ncbi:MAG: tetratricopeptide repeat protein [Acidobacteriaceae bacterium]|nr:tetratricopeptide repeat protein [Acidobacteriaceae bacterium]
MKRAAVFFFVCSWCMAQHHHGPPAETEKSIDLAKLPAPQHITGIGSSHIPITTKSSEAQQWFDQGLALMHCFWDYEALRAFEEAVRKDPNCSMCYWGLYRALEFSDKDEQAKQELDKAKGLSAKASDREQRYIRAYTDSVDQKGDEADHAFDKEMSALIQRYPDDLEAKLLLSTHPGHGYDEKGDPRPGTLYEQAMLRSLLQDYPDNAAVNHYWIHAMEVTDRPERALQSADILGALAPSSGHMVHMPGHIFYRVGDYERARLTFLNALRVDQDYMAKQHVAPKNDWNYAHNVSYLIADCAEEGRYTEALEHARTLTGLANDPDHSGSPWFYVLQIGSTEQRLAIRFWKWDDVIKRPMQFGVPDDKVSLWALGYRDGLVQYATGMRAIDDNRFPDAKNDATVLDARLWRLSQQDVADDQKPARDEVLKILGTASLELRGRLEFASGDVEEGRKLLERADESERKLGYSEPPLYSRPALEVLGAAWMRAGKFEDARNAFQSALARRPKSGWCLYGIAAAWNKEGNRKEAVDAYRAFLDAWSNADSDLPEVKAAQAYLAEK